MSKKYYQIIAVKSKYILGNSEKDRAELILKPKFAYYDRDREQRRVIPLNDRKEAGVLDDSLDIRQMRDVYKSIDQKLPLANKFCVKLSGSVKGLKLGEEDSPINIGDNLKCEGFTLALIEVTFTKQEHRTQLYKNGFDFTYAGHTGHYIRYKRSAASARNGKCLFILEELYEPMDEWSRLDLTSPKAGQMSGSELTSWEAYIALTLSGIEEKTISIPAKSVLFLRDTMSTYVDYETRCISPFDRNGEPRDQAGKNHMDEEWISFKNKIWDGEALLDESVFSEQAYADKHMLLLRSRFFKSCAFRTRFGHWFADWFDEAPDKVREHSVDDINWQNGFTMAEKVGDIKLVITESSLKYLKFSSESTDFDGLCDRYKESKLNKRRKEFKKQWEEIQERLRKWNAEEEHQTFCLQCLAWLLAVQDGKGDIEFGIVKTDHASYDPTKPGDRPCVRTNYQMLNTLGFNGEKKEVKALLQEEIDNIKECKKNPETYLKYLNRTRKEKETERAGEMEDQPGSAEDQNQEPEGSQTDDSCEQTPDNVISLLIDKGGSKNCQKFPYYIEHVKDAMAARTSLIRRARLDIDGCYATLFGNPAELLYSTVNDYDRREWRERADTTQYLNDRGRLLRDEVYDEVYTTCYDDKKEICGVRSPHITMGNLFLGVNRRREGAFYEEYFDLCPEIICINSIGRPVLQQLNGADFDSDAMLITDNGQIVNAVKRQYRYFQIPVHDIEEEKDAGKGAKRAVGEQLAEIDKAIAVNKIGQIVNLSAYMNMLFWQQNPVAENLYDNECTYNPSRKFGEDREKKDTSMELYDLICRLAILSNLEIDKAKKTYKCDIVKEFGECKKRCAEMNLEEWKAGDSGSIIYVMHDYPDSYKRLIASDSKPGVFRRGSNGILLNLLYAKNFREDEAFRNYYFAKITSGEEEETEEGEAQKKPDFPNKVERNKQLDELKEMSVEEYEKYIKEIENDKDIQESWQAWKAQNSGKDRQLKWQMFDFECKGIQDLIKPAKALEQHSLLEQIPEFMEASETALRGDWSGDKIGCCKMLSPIVEKVLCNGGEGNAQKAISRNEKQKINDLCVKVILPKAIELTERSRMSFASYRVYSDTTTEIRNKVYQSVCAALDKSAYKRELAEGLLKYADELGKDGKTEKLAYKKCLTRIAENTGKTQEESADEAIRAAMSKESRSRLEKEFRNYAEARENASFTDIVIEAVKEEGLSGRTDDQRLEISLKEEIRKGKIRISVEAVKEEKNEKNEKIPDNIQSYQLDQDKSGGRVLLNPLLSLMEESYRRKVYEILLRRMLGELLDVKYKELFKKSNAKYKNSPNYKLKFEREIARNEEAVKAAEFSLHPYHRKTERLITEAVCRWCIQAARPADKIKDKEG